MEKRVSYSDFKAGLIYLNIEKCIEHTFLEVENFKNEYCIDAKRFKVVEDKIFLHHLFENIIELLRKEHSTFKPVLYVPETAFKTGLEKSVVAIKQLKTIKRLLPVPLIVPLSESIFTGFEGEIKELNNKCLSFYNSRKIKLQTLKRYFSDKGYTSLLTTLSSTVNLKGLYY